MASLPNGRAAHFRALAAESRAGAANLADYGARQTMLQAAHMWDQIADREEEVSSTRCSQLGPSAEQVRVLSTPKPTNLRRGRLWIAVRSFAKRLQPQQHR